MYVRPRSEDGEATTFGVSGKLWRDALIMYDRQSHSLWSQIDGVAKAGPRSGERLKKIPSQLMTWDAWRRQHPETLVLVKPVLEDSPYASYHERASWVGLPWTRDGRDDRLPSKTLVISVDLAEDGAFCVPVDKLGRERVVSGDIAGRPFVLVAADAPLATLVFSRAIEGRVLDFAWRDGRLVDAQTESVWDPRTGAASTGPLTGAALEAIAATPIYWSTWVFFHPETALW